MIETNFSYLKTFITKYTINRPVFDCLNSCGNIKMGISMTSDQEAFEFYFLSNCYSSQVNESRIFGLVVEKVLSSIRSLPYSDNITAFQKLILDKYGIEIPPTFLRSILIRLQKEDSTIEVKRDHLRIVKPLQKIEERTAEEQRHADEDSRLIFCGFNTYLENSKRETIKFTRFNGLLGQYHDRLINNRTGENDDLASVFFEWCARIFKSPNAEELKMALNKVIYSWFIYYYFHSIRRSRKKLQGFTLLLDTNVLVYLLGINGEQPKHYILYFLEKAKANNCKIAILDRTLAELNSLLDYDQKDSIRVFNNSRREVRIQIRANAPGYFSELFLNYSLQLTVDDYRPKASEANLSQLTSELRSYKFSQKRDSISEHSLNHDICLLDNGKALVKQNSIYSSKLLIVTTDGHLARFMAERNAREFGQPITNVVTLEQANFVFWIETDKATDKGFLGNTWLYVSESIRYFSTNRIDTLYRQFRENYQNEKIVPSEWRSPYLLLENEVAALQQSEMTKEEELDINKIIDKINFYQNEDINRLERENRDQKNTIAELRDQLSQSRQDQNPAVVLQVQNASPPGKPLKGASVFDLLLELFNRIFRFFGRGPDV